MIFLCKRTYDIYQLLTSQPVLSPCTKKAFFNYSWVLESDYLNLSKITAIDFIHTFDKI
jgi:hypothetical protein